MSGTQKCFTCVAFFVSSIMARYNMDEMNTAWEDYQKEHTFEEWLKEQDLFQDEQNYYKHLKDNLIDKQIGFELLPEKFTLSQLQNFYEAILDVEYDKRNFRKSLKTKTYLKKLDEKLKGQAHRPASLYIYQEEQCQVLSIKNRPII